MINMEKIEWCVRVFFKTGSTFETVRMSEKEATELFEGLNPASKLNECVREVHLIRYHMIETESFWKRMPPWGV